jgi:hypothetical protein
MSPASLKQPCGDETKLEEEVARRANGRRVKRKKRNAIVLVKKKFATNYDQELRLRKVQKSKDQHKISWKKEQSRS